MNKGTKQGTNEEIELVKLLNKNKDSKFWQTLNLRDNKNLYAVRNSLKKYSNISKQYVLPKSDIFIVKSNQLITMSDFYLDETILKEENIKFSYVLNSGISVKEKNSKSYTIQKMTIETFYKVFSNYELGCAIEYYTKDEDFDKNSILENAWNTDRDKIVKRIDELKIKYEYDNQLKLDTYGDIKRSAIKLTKFIIDKEESISNFIFKGIGAFENPFYAGFIYVDGELKINQVPNKYSITTGSGRSRGDYTVVIKP